MTHQQYRACIDACNQCVSACNHCAVSCLREDDPKPMARCIALDIDCAAFCQLAAAAMARDSEKAGAICALCADICQTCSDECTKHPMDHCKACAEACRLCAEACRGMAQTSGHAVHSTAARA